MKPYDKKNILRHIPFYLVISTDGGPDHKNTNIATKAALLGMVLILDLDVIVAFRNAPGSSWINPVEQVISLLNLALQHCGYALAACEDREIEKIKKYNAMRALQEEAGKNESVKKLKNNG